MDARHEYDSARHVYDSARHVYESGLAKEPTSRVDQNKNICKLKLPELAEIAP